VKVETGNYILLDVNAAGKSRNNGEGISLQKRRFDVQERANGSR
jgi:hypothetical protein